MLFSITLEQDGKKTQRQQANYPKPINSDLNSSKEYLGGESHLNLKHQVLF